MRITKILGLLFIIFLLGYFFTGCQYHKADITYPCDTTTVKYSIEIKAILDANCRNCHGADPVENINSFGINLYDYSTISSFALDISTCSEGQLVASVSHSSCTDASTFMPKGQPKLSDCDINKFKAWVNRGANDN